MLAVDMVLEDLLDVPPGRIPDVVGDWGAVVSDQKELSFADLDPASVLDGKHRGIALVLAVGLHHGPVERHRKGHDPAAPVLGGGSKEVSAPRPLHEPCAYREREASKVQGVPCQAECFGSAKSETHRHDERIVLVYRRTLVSGPGGDSQSGCGVGVDKAIDMLGPVVGPFRRIHEVKWVFGNEARADGPSEHCVERLPSVPCRRLPNAMSPLELGHLGDGRDSQSFDRQRPDVRKHVEL